jgi:hypothetical protein
LPVESHCYWRWPGLKPEQPDGGSHSQLEEVACADEGRWRRHAMRFTCGSIEQAGEARVEIDLN